jgi:hypothetical protein
MKRLTLLTFISLFVTCSLFAGAFLDYFQGRSDGNNIILEWRTRSETGMQGFEIQRKAGYNGEFLSVATVDPKGSNSYYTYTDRSAFKSSLSVYVYRLKIVDGNTPASFSNEYTVSHNVSSVKRTWGSIKAMFR